MLILLLSLVSLALGSSPVVHLNYASYRGSSTHGISQWLGMRYAAAPVGDLRFEGPQDPPVVTGVQKATQVCWTKSKMDVLSLPLTGVSLPAWSTLYSSSWKAKCSCTL